MTDGTRQIITNALSHYDKNMEANDKEFNEFKYYFFEQRRTDDLDRNVVVFYDKDRKEIKRYKYEYVGIYHSDGQIWTWTWALAKVPKNLSALSKKILNYGLDMTVSKDNLFLKTELITSKFLIDDAIQLEIHLAISSYIAKVKKVFAIHVTAESFTDAPYKINKTPQKGGITYYLYLFDMWWKHCASSAHMMVKP